MSETENVRVAVRVRPFNSREKQRNAQSIVAMDDNTTLLFSVDTTASVAAADEPKRFTFDRSYWSHNGFTEADNGLCIADDNHENGLKYADQETVYRDLGHTLLMNAWDGYNAAMFAYGQTGSGKSYSIVGYGQNKGIVPRFCEEIFQTIEHRSGDGMQVEVTLSMLEIYNEVAKDLLNVQKLQQQTNDNNNNSNNNSKNQSKSKKKGLKVREHPTKGFYAEGLKSFLVTNYKEIEDHINEGTTNRSIAATNMNETSSRAHTIIVINLIQKSNNTTKQSSINLVDLAGSERLSGTQATGDRLKEGVSINQSLSCVGNCIHALAEKAQGKNVKVPYRDSVLTRLLQNALGGNSKTVMLATISPADINYDETLSTLRYADRAKQIRNHAKINKDSTDKLVRELREENEKLKRLMETGTTGSGMANGSATPTPINGMIMMGAMSPDALNEAKQRWEDEMRAAMEENERQMAQMKQSYEERLSKEAEDRAARHKSDQPSGGGGGGQDDRQQLELDKRDNPYLSNLNFDEQLSGKICYIIRKGVNTIGKSEDCAIQLMGPSIQEHHALVHRLDSGKVILERCSDDCRVLLNGDVVNTKVNLSHNDRLLFGTTQLFVFTHSDQTLKSKMTYADVSFELAQEEIATKAGFALNNDDQSMEQALLNKDLLEVIPTVDEANAISEELEKFVRFEIMLVSPQFLGKPGDRTEVYVRMRNIESGQEFEWTKDEFLNRLYVMKEMYQNYESGEEDWDLPPERDPFVEDAHRECHIGTAQVYLQSLAFMIELKEQLSINDYTGSEVGIVNVEVVPCDQVGNEYDERDDVYVDSPQELMGRSIHFVVKVNGCRGLPSRFTDIYVRFRVFLDEEDIRTDTMSDTSNPDFNFKKIYSFSRVTQQLVDYLKDGFINLQIWGKQSVKFTNIGKQSTIGGRNTKQLFQEELDKQGNELMTGFKMNGRIVDPNKQSIIVELLLMKKQQARQQQRIENIRRLVEMAENCRKKKISVQLVKDLLFTTTPEMADALINQVPEGFKFLNQKPLINLKKTLNAKKGRFQWICFKELR
ncbi:kinesin-like protein KIF28P [Oppia nitens]|uniref:kinesin-like protein KIF28P n=1 Tax=Oppia nitens TaxID=1686743 RepID=UPI0023DC3A1D|nr:kinesin-like protein KIF28P [Oppia nitens]